MPSKNHPTIGCCGIDCGLCPRYYTVGLSRCPGCGGEGFEDKHPSCGYLTCCAKKHGLEVCAQCSNYPCKKFEDRSRLEHDSFVTHKRIFQNHEKIKAQGIDAFLAIQSERIQILTQMLTYYDDGKSKSLYCLATALLPIESLRAALETTRSDDIKSNAKSLRTALSSSAEDEGVVLALTK